MMRAARWWCLAALLALAACNKDKDVEKPAQLVPINSAVEVDRAWRQSVKGGDLPLRLGLGVAILDGHVYAAGRKGEVAAFDLATGRQLWSRRIKQLLYAGSTGVSKDLVVVGSSKGDVVALSAVDGTQKWRIHVNGEVLSAPAVNAKLVVLRTVDGRLRGLSVDDGHELWSHDENVPRLSLRGSSIPVILGDMIICGFDNGKVVAVSATDGSVLWEVPIAPPHGRTELERLVDIDSAVAVDGDDIYTIGFQGRVAMLARETGQVWWAHDASSYRGLTIDKDLVFYSTADGEVVALRRRTGAELWRQAGLKHRGLSAPVLSGGAIAVADFQGYVHWLDKATGSFVARAATGGKRISTTPAVSGDLLVTIDDTGRLSAFKVGNYQGKPIPPAPESENAPSAPTSLPATAPDAGAATLPDSGAVAPPPDTPPADATLPGMPPAPPKSNDAAPSEPPTGSPVLQPAPPPAPLPQN